MLLFLDEVDAHIRNISYVFFQMSSIVVASRQSSENNVFFIISFHYVYLVLFRWKGRLSQYNISYFDAYKRDIDKILRYLNRVKEASS